MYDEPKINKIIHIYVGYFKSRFFISYVPTWSPLGSTARGTLNIDDVEATYSFSG